MTDVDAGRRTVEVPHPEKVMFPDEGLTKLDVARYYRDVAGVMIPHLRDRPLHMERFPDGAGGRELQQKRVPDHFPGWIARAEVERKSGGSLTQVVCNDAATLVYLAGQACLTPHPWLSTRASPMRPDLLIFDLDPTGRATDALVAGAHALRERLEQLELSAAAKSTGSRGIHVVVPLDGRDEFDRVRVFARELAEWVASADPGRFTVEQRKEKRRGRVFIDILRNSYAQTAVAPYAIRARTGAPVAAPLEWDEVGRGFDPRRHTLRNVRRRLDRRGDPWAKLYCGARPLGPAAARLRELREGGP